VTDALSKGFPLILDQLAKIDKTARKKLRDLNLPDSDELIELKKDGSWKPVSSDHNHRRQQRSMLGLELALSEHESPSWFAAQNLRLIGEIREHWPNSLGAISAAFKLGILVEREWWKIKHETVAIRGYRDAENRKKGRAQGTVTTKQNAAQRYAIVVSRAKAFWASQPTLKNKLTQTARHIEALKLDQLRLSGRRDFLGFEAIKKHLRKASRRGDLK
jgi:hypothetical protein